MERRQLVGLVLVCLGLLGLVAVGGVFGETQTTDTDRIAVGEDVSFDGIETESGEAHPRIDEQLLEANGEIEVIVSLVEPDEKASVADLQNHANATQESLVTFASERPGVTIENRFWITNAAVVTIDTNQVAIAELAEVEGVEALWENAEVEPQSTQATVASAGGPEPASDDMTYGLEQISAADAWDTYGTQGTGTTVAVLDTGVDPDHQDIDLAEWAEFDSSGNEIESDPYDSGDHGTHVSGTVSGGNESGTHVGVVPETELHHGGVLTDEGGTFSAVIGGMQWAVDNDVDVITMSLGSAGGGYTDSMVDPISNAKDAGTTVVASVGNTGEGGSSTPGNTYDDIGVGNSNEDEDIRWSSGGEEIDTNDAWEDPPDDWPDEYIVPTIAAPGVSVWSTVPGDDYEYKTGTSMAAPHVAGTVALIESAVDDELSPDDIEEALVETAWKPDDWDEDDAKNHSDGQDTRYGYGIINASAAIDYLKDDESGAEFQVDILNATDAVEGEPVEVTTEIENVGNETDTQTVTLDAGDLGTNSTTVELDEGEQVEETLTIDTAAGDAGEYTATVETDDDDDSTTVTVLESAAFEVDITDTTDPVEGEDIDVEFEVENTGDVTDTQTVELSTDPDIGENSTDVTLDGGESTETSLTVSTAQDDADEYTVTVESDDTDDSATVTVLEPANFAVSILSATDPIEGDTLEVEFEVENTGDVEDTQTLDLDVPDLGSDETSVTLDGGESTEETLSVSTDAGDAGTYTATVASEDATDETTVEVLESASFDVDILTTTEPVEGEDMEVEFEVENTGDVEDTQTVELSTDSDIGENSTSLTLAGGESTEETLSVGTESGDAGEYTATVESDDDEADATVTVLAAAAFDITILETNEPVEGEDLEVEFEAENTGDASATETVTLDAKDLGTDSVDVTLDGGESSEETLSVSTGDGDADEYTVTVESDDDDDSATVTVLEAASFDVEILSATDPVAGEDLEVDIEAENTGGVEATQTLDLDVGALGDDELDVTLGGGESTEETLSVTTEAGDAGTYTATASSEDDSDDATVEVLEPASFAVDILDATDPVEGDAIEVEFEVENTGDVEATQTLELSTDPDIGENSTTLTLDGGESMVETLSVATEAGDAGTYTVTVESDDTDESDTVTVLEAAEFDVDILDVDEPVEGESLAVTAEIENVGDTTDSGTVTLEVGDLGTNSTTVELDADEVVEETLSVGTAAGDAGEYTATVESADDEDSTTVTVLEAASFELDILNATEPVEGDAIEVEFEVENTGDVTETQTLDLTTAPDIGENSTDVTLDSGESTVATLSVDTGTGDAGEYTATVASEDDSAEETVEVLEPASFAVDILDATDPVEGDAIEVEFEVENTGDVEDTQTLDLTTDPDIGENRTTLTLAGDESAVETLSIATDAGDAGEYTATVESGDDSDETTVDVLEAGSFQVDILDAADPVEGEDLEVTAEIENTGDASKTETVTLDAEELGTDSVDVTLDAGEASEETLAVGTTAGDAGEYTVSVATDDDEDSANVTVLEAASFEVDILNATDAVAGDAIEVEFEVENTGDVEATQTVDLDVGAGSNETDVTLAGGESTEETLSVATESDDAGEYTATVTSEDDSDETTVDVLEPASFAVSILNPTGPVEGEPTEVEFEVENTGETEETETVELTTAPDIGQNSTTLTLAGGETTVETLSVDTEFGDAGEYTVTVESDDHADDATVTVLAEGLFVVDILEAAGPVEGEPIEVEFEVENTGDVDDTQTVTLDVPDLGSDEMDVTLDGGESTEETLSVGTGTGDADEYTATVASDDDSDETTVEVLEPATFAVDILETTDPIEGEDIEVEFDVENTGDVTETKTVELTTDPDIGENSTQVTLDGDESTEETLSVATDGADPVEYNVTVASEDDTADANVTVLTGSAFAVSTTGTTEPVEGDDLAVEFEVENTGHETETQTVTLDIPDLGSDEMDVTLDGSETTVETLSVATDAGDAGEYTATVASANDTDEATVEVLEPASFAVSILNTTEPVEGDQLEVTAGIENTGDVTGTETVTLAAGDLGTNNTIVELDGGESTEETLSVDTDAGDAGEHAVNVTSADDDDTATATVLAEASFTVDIIDTVGPVEGEPIDVEFEAENTGDVTDTRTVTLDVAGLGSDEMNVTLAGGESTEETLSVSTSAGDAGEYNLTVDSPDDSDSANVTVLADASFDVEALETNAPVAAQEELVVETTVTNTGDVEATGTVEFLVEGSSVDNTSVQLAAGESWTGEFVYETHPPDRPAVELTVATADDAAETTAQVHRPVPRHSVGDVSEDGDLHIVDVARIQQHLVEMEPDPFNEELADVNRDGEITIVDAVMIQQYLAGLRDAGITTISTMVVPESVTAGESLNTSAVVENAGGMGTIQAVEYRLAESEDDLDENATEVVEVVDLGPGDTADTDAAIPTDHLEPGEYVLGAFTDDTAVTTAVDVTAAGPDSSDRPVGAADRNSLAPVALTWPDLA